MEPNVFTAEITRDDRSGIKISISSGNIIHSSLSPRSESGAIDLTSEKLNVATKLLEKFQTNLATARDGETHRVENSILQGVDYNGDNSLHVAARLSPQIQTSTGFAVLKQMKAEIDWFKEIKRLIPCELKTLKNNERKTPDEIFNDEHTKMSNDTKDVIRESVEKCMAVSPIVAQLSISTVFGMRSIVDDHTTSILYRTFVVLNEMAFLTSTVSFLTFM
ncbi:hypothetical protein Fmac_031055 [Flemingia macrophylla]|uniref:Uncharacterized protein n=1 Tax=Flemingia macrophylla TaxID=520843 RepID=A0ABD1L0Y5_9FABA